MAKIVCSKSGVIFNCEHMPTTLSSSTYTHPLFHVPQKRLIALAGQWAAQKLTPTESYLLYLALLDSTELIQWRTQASYHKGMDAIVSSNMENLLSIIAKINLIHHPAFALPSFSINPSTHTLDNSHHWIQAWIENYQDWYDGQRESRLRESLKDREHALQRLIKSSVPTSAYAKTLATWAATAGSFPTFDTTHPISKQPIPLSEYWQQIITSVANEDKLWRYPRKDIEELITHCEDNITHGNIYAHTLMKYLRDGLLKYDDYLGFGDLSPSSTSTPFTIIPSDATVYQTNLHAALNTAPLTESQKHQYPTHSAWLKAYTKWKLSKYLNKSSP